VVGPSIHVKLCLDFSLCIFSSLTYLKEPVFSKRDLLRWKVPANLSLFLKSEKIPTLLYIRKGSEYRPFHDLRAVLEAEGTGLKSRMRVKFCSS
jgi:hypothetical protein